MPPAAINQRPGSENTFALLLFLNTVYSPQYTDAGLIPQMIIKPFFKALQVFFNNPAYFFPTLNEK